MNDLRKKLAEYMAGFVSDSDVATSKLQVGISVAILKKRVSMGMNQSEFARYMGVTQGMVSRWESGENNFSLAALAPILEKLDMSLRVEDAEKTEAYTSTSNNYVSTYPTYGNWMASIGKGA